MKTVIKFFIVYLAMGTFLMTCTPKKMTPNQSAPSQNEMDIKSYVAAKTPIDLADNSYYRIIQFGTVPPADEQAVLKSPGIKILEYIPDYKYLVAITTDFQKELLLTTSAETIKKLEVGMKINNRLANWDIPVHASVGSKAKVGVIAMKGIRAKNYESDLKALNLSVDYYGGDARFAYLTLSKSEVERVAQLPWVRNVEIIDEKGDPEGGK